MYFCSECFSPLTEFDVNFNKNLMGKFTPGKCKCATCLADVEYLRERKKPNSYPYFLAYAFMLVAICLARIGNIFFYQYEIDIDLNNDFAWALYDFAEIFLWTNVLAHAVAYIVCVFFCLLDFTSLEDESYSYTSSKTKTTYDSATESFVTSPVTEYDGESHGLAKFLLFLVYPFWGIFVYIYRLVKYHKDINKRCTKEVISAYNKTEEETEKFIIPGKSCIDSWYENRKKEYAVSIESIRSKYGYLGEEALEDKIKEIKEPTFEFDVCPNPNKVKLKYKLILIANVKHDDITNNDSEMYLGTCSFIKNTENKKIIYRDYAVYIPDQKDVLELFDLAEGIRPEIGEIYIYSKGKTLAGVLVGKDNDS